MYSPSCNAALMLWATMPLIQVRGVDGGYMRRLLALAVVLVMVLPLVSVADETQGPSGMGSIWRGF